MMSVRVNNLITIGVLLFVAMGVFTKDSYAQASSGCGGASGDYVTPSPSWGYIDCQVDQGSLTTTLTAEFGVNPNTTPGLILNTVTLPASKVIHEIHGNVTFAVWPKDAPSSCGIGSIIAQLRDQNGNTIASVYLLDFSNSTDSVDIRGTFPSGLNVSSIHFSTSPVSTCALTLSWGVVMS